MAHKKEVKKSEARVLLFLLNSYERNKNLPYMSLKLEIEYNYLSRILDSMAFKDWITKSKIRKVNHYNLLPKGTELINKAQAVLLK